jgi:hypothetical protein
MGDMERVKAQRDICGALLYAQEVAEGLGREVFFKDYEVHKIGLMMRWDKPFPSYLRGVLETFVKRVDWEIVFGSFRGAGTRQ